MTHALDALLSPAGRLSNSPLPPLKLGVLASGTGSNFAALAQGIAQGELPAEIKVLIYNNPQATVKDKAQAWKIPSQLLNHRDFSRRTDLDQAIVKVLQEYHVDWVIMAGWLRVVTDVLLDAFPDRVVNLHPSLLPSFRGLNAIEQALAAGVKITGCTVHLVRLEVDSGPILVQAAVPVLPDDDPASLHGRIQIQEHRILKQAIHLLHQAQS